jgi:hypothetical protein
MYIPGKECGNYQNAPNVYAMKPTILPCDFTENTLMIITIFTKSVLCMSKHSLIIFISITHYSFGAIG